MNQVEYVDKPVEPGVVRSNLLRERPVYEKIDKQYWQRQNDTFNGKSLVKEKSNNGKFDFTEALKNFGKGLLSPVTALVKHPVMAIGMIAGTVLACTLVPVLGVVAGVGFGALSLYQLGKGIHSVYQNCKQGEYDKAEKSFNEVGQGFIGTVLSIFGIKQSARVVKEAKMLESLNTTSLTPVQKAQIASEVKNGTMWQAIKETGSLFFTKSGWKSIIHQFKPSSIIQRAKDTYNFLFKGKEVEKLKSEKVKFAETAEGKRRAGLTSAEIEKEVKTLYKEAFDEYGIPEELRPTIEITRENISKGGSYSASVHRIRVNEEAYRSGAIDLPNAIKHEATHAQQAILRQRLPMGEKVELTKQFLLDKIRNGEQENILLDGAILQFKITKAPKLTPKMKVDFAKFAQEKLYSDTVYTVEQCRDMVKPLLEANPEFVRTCANPEEALTIMANYAKSHNFRYKLGIDYSSGFNVKRANEKLLLPLSEQEHQLAVKSFSDSIECLEGNAVNRDIIGSRDFNQYQFSTEEVLAQQKGINFELTKLRKQLADLKIKPDYDVTEEARLLDKIKEYELTLQYKLKGQEMYKLKNQLRNHPEDTSLAKKVASMEKEIELIKSQKGEISEMYADDLLGVTGHVETKQYTLCKDFERPATGATVYVPYSTTSSAHIIGENQKNNKA